MSLINADKIKLLGVSSNVNIVIDSVLLVTDVVIFVTQLVSTLSVISYSVENSFFSGVYSSFMLIIPQNHGNVETKVLHHVKM